MAQTMRPNWDTWALGVAEAVSKRADCTRSQVGAVLLRPDHTIAATGYNGAPPGQPGCMTAAACPRGRLTLEELAPLSSYDTGPGMCIALHAEQNCLAYLRESAAGFTMAVTRQPCFGCMRLMGAYRLARIIWPHGEATNIDSRQSEG